MPKPKKGESKKDYVSRCIPIMIDKEGRKPDQAAAICYSIYKQKGSSKKFKKPISESIFEYYINKVKK